MNLQSIFVEPVLEQVLLDPGYSGHANDVWLVHTASKAVVVRVVRQHAPGNPFWDGLVDLFGIDPRRVFDLQPLNALLRSLSPIPVPRVLHIGVLDARPYVIVEHMPGQVVADLRSLPETMLEDLGRALALIHARHFSAWGHPTTGVRYPLASFHPRLVATLHKLAGRLPGEERALRDACDEICTAALQLPPPTAGALVMVDLDPTQFLAEDMHWTAIVDTEAYVVAPPALDFIGLEYLLDARGAAAVTRGYTTVLPLPALAAVRPVYRYLYRLLEVQGKVDLREWMTWPWLFDT